MQTPPTGLAALRLRNGLSQAALAELAGVRQATISHLETGRSTPEPMTLAKLAAALGVETCTVYDAVYEAQV